MKSREWIYRSTGLMWWTGLGDLVLECVMLWLDVCLSSAIFWWGLPRGMWGSPIYVGQWLWHYRLMDCWSVGLEWPLERLIRVILIVRWLRKLAMKKRCWELWRLLVFDVTVNVMMSVGRVLFLIKALPRYVESQELCQLMMACWWPAGELDSTSTGFMW